MTKRDKQAAEYAADASIECVDVDICVRLRRARASMLGTDDEETFWACHDAANEIERLRLRWIPVSEQLPGDGQSVVACFEGGGMTGQVGEATLNKRGGWFSTDRGAWCASHWMPLPEPPEVK
jgi:hypothetical protein